MAVFARALFVFSVLFFPLISWGAEPVKFRYTLSIYLDDRGVGLQYPEGVACNEKSLLVVGDTGNNRLLRYTFQEGTLKAEAEIKIPQLSNPIRVQVNSQGEIFALDGKQRRIIRLRPNGEFQGYISPEGIPSPSAFVPRSFKIDRDDNLYILDIFSERVLVLSPDGKYRRNIEFPKEFGFFSDLAVDWKGSVLLIDCVKARIFSAAKESPSFSPLTGSLKEYLNFPTYITTDQRGTIYIVDENSSSIAILGPDGSFLSRQLSMGWNEGRLYYPSQMCINEKGEVFIADKGNSRMQIFAVIK